ncbi:hypothetical protein HQ545_03860 [Candidatus Woesearchaeota archaeon]|nr:hypothetical protein [Candidatus Woesearchaeota archaeon]
MSSRLYSNRLYKKRPKPGVKAPVRPKAFKSEESAKKWAEENQIQKFRVEAITDKKFKIRMS